MPFDVLIRRQAASKLSTLPKSERERLTEKITLLGNNPDDQTLDARKLRASRFWRLRVGKWRIIYDRQDATKVISIELIKPRGDAYK